MSQRWVGGLRGSRVLFGLQVNRIYLVAWARTISLARLARLAGIEYMCILLEEGCYHRIRLPHTTIVEAK